METLRQKAFKDLCQDLAQDSYQLYCNDSNLITAEDVADLIIPIAKIILLSTFRGVPEHIWDDLISEAYVKVYYAIKDKKCEHGRPIFPYFYSVIRNTFITHIDSYLPLAKNTIPKGYVPPKSGYSIRAVETQMFLEKLPEVIRGRVLRMTRFTGFEYEACKYILNRFLMDKRVVYIVLTNRYYIEEEHIPFFVDYVITLYRIALFGIKKRYLCTSEPDEYTTWVNKAARKGERERSEDN